MTFKLDDRTVRPDGLIEVTRGKTSWTALVEVKTGADQLQAKQLEDYLDVAKAYGFDAVVTISNEIPSMPGQHPTAVDKRRLRGKVRLLHLSWAHVVSFAVTVREHTGVTDPDQAWILSELIRYLKYPRSGALGFETMGKEWVEVRESVRAGTLRKTDKGAPVVANRFDGLVQFLALELGARLGADVTAVLPKREKEDPTLRTQALTAQLVDSGSMTGTLRIPGAAGDLVVKVLLRANQIECYVDLHAPQTGRNKTRISWLVRQLKDADPNLRIEAFLPRARSSAGADTLGHVRENPEVLDVDPTKEIRAFRIAQVTRMGIKRDTGKGSFIESVSTSLDTFYRDVLQNMKAWAAPAPKLDKGADNPVVSDEATRPEVVASSVVAVPSPPPTFGVPEH